MRIRKLYLKDIGPFDEVKFEFKPRASGKAEIHILTGPNGSGKTTVLQALVNLFSGIITSDNAFSKRMRTEQHSKVEISYDDGVSEIKTFSFDGRKSYPSKKYIEEVIFGKVTAPAFANSGYRKIDHVMVNAIQELEIDPWKDALLFEKESKTNFTLNQWLANSISKRAIEKEKHNSSQAKKFASAMVIVEKAISEIAGFEVKFDLKTSPLSLVACTNNAELNFDILPDGLRSAISWIGDILMRLDLMKWDDDLPVNEQNILLFLDEIEVHLHPAWQRKVLPAVQKLFPNAQIFLTTHSPFVVNSIDSAWVYELKVKDGKAYLGEVIESKSSASYRSVLREVFDIEKPFGGETQDELDKFQQQRDQILRGETINENQFIQRARKLAKQSEELLSIISLEIRQINHITGKDIEL